MSSTSDLGDGTKVHGRWKLNGSELTLIKGAGRPFRWTLKAVPRANSVDLVPEELKKVYAENPANTGSKYRRYSQTPTPDPAVAALADPAAASANTPNARAEPGPSRVAPTPVRAPEVRTAANIVANSPARSPGNGANSGASAQREAAVAPGPSGPPQSREPTVFVYQPGPVETLDLKRVRGPGVASLQLDERGRVRAVKIVESTGDAQFDSEAADIFRRWRAQPGPAREVEMPVTSVMNGKRTPVRVPTSSGTMTSG